MSIYCLLITLNVLIIVHPTSCSNHSLHYVHYDCPRSQYTYASGTTFESNLTSTLLNVLPVNASLAGYSSHTAGEEGVDQVHALSFCRGDVTGQDCRDCVEAAARTIIDRCRFLKQGIVWYEECTLRYSNQSFLSPINGGLEVTPNHRHYNFSGTFRYLEEDEATFDGLMNRLIQEAAYAGIGSGFATGETNLSTSNWVLHGLVQCRPEIGGAQCEKCLRQALRQRDGWNTPMVFLPSCSIQFDLYPNAHISPPSSGNDGVPLTVIVPVVVVCVLVLGCIIFVGIRYYCRIPNEHSPQHEQDHPRKLTWLELVWATACFSSSRIRGRGGYGNVYEGNLFDGTHVAVKRLNIRGSLQGEAEFLAEVTTITSLKHDNIICLKGYCKFLRERLLVYEYVSNRTLEHHLHGNGGDLSWEKRMSIALKLAEVFSFLHQRDPAIIHRDIKPSNILLDDEFQPKVGDFGVAKLCSESRTHLTTIVKGSPGYVDPSYYTSDHLRRESDVFAFGVVLLELITGRKAIFTVEQTTENRYITKWAEPLVKEAISAGNFDALVDQKLGATYDRDEMDRMITCAAICVRNSPEERPTMRQVAGILKGSTGSNNDRGEIKEKLMSLWQNEGQRRICAEDGLNTSPRTQGGSTANGRFDIATTSTGYEASHKPQESQDLYFTAASLAQNSTYS